MFFDKALRFPSDHRVVGLKMFLPKRCKIANAVKNKKSYKVIPEHKMGQARRKFTEDLENSKVVITDKLLQPTYDQITENLNKVVEKFLENNYTG